MVEEPEDQADGGADHQARDERKVECAVLAAVKDVSGQAAEAKGKLRCKIKKRANDDEHRSDEKEQTSQLLSWFHYKIVAPEQT
jgi:hypothetical protein